MPLKDLLKKKDKDKDKSPKSSHGHDSPEPEFVFMRSDTNTQELISPPTFSNGSMMMAASPSSSSPRRPSHLRTSSNTSSITSTSATPSQGGGGSRPHSVNGGRPSSVIGGTSGSTGGSGAGKDGGGGERRLSQLLHMRPRVRSRTGSSASARSVHVPGDLPDIVDVGGKNEDREAQWERRATILAGTATATTGNHNTTNVQGGSGIGRGQVDGADGVSSSRPTTPLSVEAVMEGLKISGDGDEEMKRRSRRGSVSDPQGDENIQEAIRLHESGDLDKSTAMFGRLADPSGPNNALSQVLYGLALRHGWGIPPNPPLAIHYLSLAAQNSALIESAALESGLKKGGAAKGELILAIYELANCFRHGWGLSKDPVAARQYYETAANLGDVDAMNEVAGCYEVGFGGKKDKMIAAKYYRLAEQNGNKTLGNSWIWKEKYDPK